MSSFYSNERRENVRKILLSMIGLLALAAAPLARAVDCLPNPLKPTSMAFGSIPAGVSTTNDHYLVYVCNTTTGYKTWIVLFSTSDPLLLYQIGLYLDGQLTAAQATLLCQENCQGPAAQEATYIKVLQSKYAPMAVVAFNQSNPNRSVYKANADGTLAPSPVPGASVQVGQPCDPQKRVAGTSYYSVAGDNNASAPGTTLPDGSYASCTVPLAMGSYP